MTEDALLAAYRRANDRVEPCACGGWITADPTSLVEIFGAVLRHNEGDQHWRWRRRREDEEMRDD